MTPPPHDALAASFVWWSLPFVLTTIVSGGATMAALEERSGSLADIALFLLICFTSTDYTPTNNTPTNYTPIDYAPTDYTPNRLHSNRFAINRLHHKLAVPLIDCYKRCGGPFAQDNLACFWRTLGF